MVDLTSKALNKAITGHSIQINEVDIYVRSNQKLRDLKSNRPSLKLFPNYFQKIILIGFRYFSNETPPWNSLYITVSFMAQL